MAGRLSSVALGVCSELFELLFKFLQFFVGEIFQIDQFISRLRQRTNDFIEFQMHRFRVAILGVLNEKHHQESDNGRPSIDDQLPGIGKMKRRTGQNPNENYEHRSRERPRASEHDGRAAGEDTKGVTDNAKEVSLLFVLFQLFYLCVVHKRHCIFAGKGESARMEDVRHGESVLWRIDLATGSGSRGLIFPPI